MGGLQYSWPLGFHVPSCPDNQVTDISALVFHLLADKEVTTSHSFSSPPSPLELSHSLVLPRLPLLPTGTNQAETMWQLQRGAL